eukprot:521525-Prorocentrum_minimum.AAC.1
MGSLKRTRPVDARRIRSLLVLWGFRRGSWYDEGALLDSVGFGSAGVQGSGSPGVRGSGLRVCRARVPGCAGLGSPGVRGS